MAQQGKGLRRYQAAYRAARAAVCPFFARRFRFEAGKEPDIAGPFLLVVNHVTELDFLLVGAMFQTPLAFVVGDTLLRAPVVGWLLRRVFGVIPKDKGMVDTGTAMGILRRLRAGQSVCLFPEGNTCFDGRTGPFPAGTGGLAQAVGVPLVTCRLSGAYLALPRWGRGIKSGRVSGNVVGIYPPEMLKKMNTVEISAVIARDLAADAFADQQRSPVAYRGKKRAEGLENALYLCPKCRKLDSLGSRDDRVFCRACGLEAALDAFGAFEGGAPYQNPRDWMDDQREWLRQRLQETGEEPVIGDDDQTLCLKGPGRRLIPAARGRMEMRRKELVIGEKHFAMEELLSLEIYRKNILLAATGDGKRYQLRAKSPFNALKYRDMFRILKADGR